MSAIDNLKKEISDLESQRDSMYEQFRQIEEQLKKKNLLLTAFNVVSSDPLIYDKWLETALDTPRPKLDPLPNSV